MLEMLVSDLEYADDMALLSSSWSDLEVTIRSLHQYCTSMGLTINCRKTKTLAGMPSSSCSQPQPILYCSSEDLVKPVSAFQYLGSTVFQYCITVLRCHPGLSKPRKHLALSTEGCGCIRGSRMSLSSVSSVHNHQCFCPKRP